MKLIIAYNVPAKFGAKSCEFCRFVKVAAPLNPKEAVKIPITRYVSVTYGIPNNKQPGMI